MTRDAAGVEKRGKARQDKVNKENESEQAGTKQQKKVASSPKRGRPRKKHEEEHEEEEEEEVNGEEEGTGRKPKQQKKEQDPDVDMEGKDDEETMREFEEFSKQLRENVLVGDVKAILEENGLDTEGPEHKLYQRCADLLFFGTCEQCPSCGGVLEFAGHSYHCTGFSTEWTKCNYKTSEGRKGDKAKLPSKLKSGDFVRKFVKSHDIPEGRPFEPLDKPFSGMTLVLTGRLSLPQGEIKQEIEKHGGKVANTIATGITAVICSEAEPSRGGSSKLELGTELGLPVIREAWVFDSIAKMMPLPLDDYSLAAELPGDAYENLPWDKRPPDVEAAESLMAELKLVGKKGVYKDTDLEDEGGKIFEKDGLIYNCAFSVCDIYINLNQYAVLQLIEVPRKRRKAGNEIYLYVKEGRVGDRRSVKQSLEKQDNPNAAIKEFERVFEELTGNPFLPWEREKKISKVRNKYFPVDMAPGVDARAGALQARELGIAALRCKADPRLHEFLKVFFGQTAYRYAMTEAGCDAPDLPLGNVTDWHISQSKQYLIEFADYLKSNPDKDNAQRREQMCLDFSNKWFSLVHSTRPFVIHDLVELVELAGSTLEIVRDISHASQFVIGDMTGDMARGTVEDPMGDRYAKLGCEMIPLDKDGEDYQMILKYLTTTMEPLKFPDGEYGVIVEDIVQLESETAPSMKEMEKIPNRMLLWCAMRTSNLVANIHRGMQPACVDAPAPYHAFGSGLYCTDAAGKAARYGLTAVDRPEGFLLLAIVGLGEEFLELPAPEKPVKEYEEAGVPVKILGKKAPDSKEYFEWKGVTVPCGTLKETKVKGVMDFMDFNEYVTYDRKKVKPVFLVKIRYEGVAYVEE